MARVFICVGHGGSDSGAVGHVVEKEATLAISVAAKAELERHGVEVGISRTSDEDVGLTREVNMANDFGADLVIAVHANAGGGYGFEAYVQTNEYDLASRVAAEKIESQVESIGQSSRGIKTKLGSYGTDYYYWLRNTNAPTVLLEGFFVDTEDAYDFDTTEKQHGLGKAYAHGILDYLGIDIQNEEEDIMYKTINEVPGWAKPTIQKLVDKRLLQGDENGDLNLTESMVRIFVVLDRAGNFD